MSDVQEMQANQADGLTLGSRIQMLNADQDCIFTRVSDHLRHQYMHEHKLCCCTEIQPLHMFISGVVHKVMGDEGFVAGTDGSCG